MQEIQHFCRRFQIVDGGITARFSALLPPRKDTLYHLCKSGRLGVCRFLFQPALQLENAGFQLPQLLICDFDFAVDVSPLRADSALLHLKGGYAQMHGGDQVYSLPLIAAVVYTLGMISLFKIRIADFSPRRPPFLRFGLLVPVGGGNGLAFVLPLFRVVDFVAVLIKNILLFLLRAPCAVLLNGAHGQQDMGVGVAVVLIV